MPEPALDANLLPAVTETSDVPVYRPAFTFNDVAETEERVRAYPDSPDDERLLYILGAIAEAKSGFAAACQKYGWSSILVRQWAHRDTPAGFRELYLEARSIEMDGFQDELMRIGAGEHRNESERTTPGSVYRDQLLTKIMQWRMQRQAPALFGDRGAVDLKGKPVPAQVIVVGGQTITF